jgi:uncharacterized protein (DUF302 family)
VAEITEFASRFDFGETLQRLTDAIEGAGMSVFASIDHAAGARGVGLSMPPTTVLLYGSPRGGTPLMQAHPRAALDLPLRVLVREAPDGTVLAAFHPIAGLLAGAGVPEDMAARLAPAQMLLAKTIAA